MVRRHHQLSDTGSKVPNRIREHEILIVGDSSSPAKLHVPQPSRVILREIRSSLTVADKQLIVELD